MRIGYIIPSLFHLSTFVFNEMVEVKGQGHKIIIVPLYQSTFFGACYQNTEKINPEAVLPSALINLRIVVLAFLNFLTHPWLVVKTLASIHWAAGINPYAHWGIFAITPKAIATAWHLQRLKVDHIHAHFAGHMATYAGIAGKISSIPFSFTAHAFDIYCKTLKLRNDTLGWKIRHADHVFVISEHALKHISRLYPSAKPIHLIRVGVPLNHFVQEPPTKQNGSLQLLCIANFYDKKGIDTLIDACGILHEKDFAFNLKIFGDGPLGESFSLQIARLKLNSKIMLGKGISQEEVAHQIKASHVFVMPCRRVKTGDMDGIPTVFMEAMAIGRPVISCPISGIPELVRDRETGFLVPSNDPVALARSIMELGKDEALRIRLGLQGRALVEKQHDIHTNISSKLNIIMKK